MRSSECPLCASAAPLWGLLPPYEVFRVPALRQCCPLYEGAARWGLQSLARLWVPAVWVSRTARWGLQPPLALGVFSHCPPVGARRLGLQNCPLGSSATTHPWGLQPLPACGCPPFGSPELPSGVFSHHSPLGSSATARPLGLCLPCARDFCLPCARVFSFALCKDFLACPVLGT